MEDEEPMIAALDAFKKTHGDHYEVRDRLGSGEFGVTFRAADLRRDVDVCLKFFKAGTAPSAARREWLLTSRLKHPSVNDTHTVEHVPAGDGAPPNVVVVSRYQPGETLESIVGRLDSLADDVRADVVDALLLTVVFPLCDALTFCHKEGVGHGDLHVRNIMVDSPSPPVLIDFGNANSRIGEPELAENELMQADVRALWWIVGCVVQGTYFADPLSNALKRCESAEQIKHGLTDFRTYAVPNPTGGATSFDWKRWARRIRKLELFRPDLALSSVRVMAAIGEVTEKDALLEVVREVVTEKLTFKPTAATITGTRSEVTEALRIVLGTK
jgi:serine/threonine protein kinase